MQIMAENHNIQQKQKDDDLLYLLMWFAVVYWIPRSFKEGVEKTILRVRLLLQVDKCQPRVSRSLLSGLPAANRHEQKRARIGR